MEFFQHEVDLAGGVKSLNGELIWVTLAGKDLAEPCVEVPSVKTALNAHLDHKAGRRLQAKSDLAPTATINR